MPVPGDLKGTDETEAYIEATNLLAFRREREPDLPDVGEKLGLSRRRPA